jgi:hypothetical protein
MTRLWTVRFEQLGEWFALKAWFENTLWFVGLSPVIIDLQLEFLHTVSSNTDYLLPLLPETRRASRCGGIRPFARAQCSLSMIAKDRTRGLSTGQRRTEIRDRLPWRELRWLAQSG